MICKYEHDGDCCNSGATQYMCKCKKPCDAIMPITNADRIRAMSDRELAKHFSGIICDINEGVEYHESRNIWLEWLKQPVEDIQ